MINLSVRSTQKEIMDDFKGSAKELELLLSDINRVNDLLGGYKITLDVVFRLIEANPKKSYTILDIGCADGEMLRKLADRARKLQIPITFEGIDLNEQALEIGKRKSSSYPEITYKHQNAFDIDDKNFDLVITTLTLHHFEERNIRPFLIKFSKMASIGVVVNDLHRSRLAYYLFKVFSIIFIKTSTAKIDGSISITRGFKRTELEKFSIDLTNTRSFIKWKWAFRYLWVIQKL